MLGHGTNFLDLNVSVDPDAVGAVLALLVRFTLIPCDAARKTPITDEDRDGLARTGAASAWVAQSAQAWLTF